MSLFSFLSSSAITSAVSKIGNKIITGFETTGVSLPIGNLLRGASKIGAPIITKATPFVGAALKSLGGAAAATAKRPVAVIAGAAIAGVAGPGLGRGALGVGVATAVGGPIAGTITAGLVGVDYAKQAVSGSIASSNKYINKSYLNKSNMINAYEAAKFLGFPNPYDFQGKSSDEVIGAALNAGYKPPELKFIENTTPPASGIAREVSAGLNGLLPENISNVILPAAAGALGAYAITKTVSRTKTTKRKAKVRKTKAKKKTVKRARVGTAKQYRRKGGKSVHYTKNGQPYIKLASGKARFIKK